MRCEHSIKDLFLASFDTDTHDPTYIILRSDENHSGNCEGISRAIEKYFLTRHQFAKGYYGYRTRETVNLAPAILLKWEK